jgi:REP element-mobilizing transposase RayT
MPRSARIVFSSMPYHIISRGNNQESVFEDGEEHISVAIIIGYNYNIN